MLPLNHLLELRFAVILHELPESQLETPTHLTERANDQASASYVDKILIKRVDESCMLLSTILQNESMPPRSLCQLWHPGQSEVEHSQPFVGFGKRIPQEMVIEETL